MTAITHLWLEHFRNYTRAELEVGARPVILTGPNGAGKTNILEALSLFSPGRGVRKAAVREMQNQMNPGAWAASITLQSGDITHHLATARDAESRIDKRILKINGTREPKQAVLCRYLALSWATPQMDTLFLEGNTVRRKFLDRLVYGFDPEHAARVASYEQSVRERAKLLSERGADPYWLSVLEQQMAEGTVAITIARLEAIARIQEAMRASQNSFPKADLVLDGTAEQLLNEGVPAIEAEAQLAGSFQACRNIDAARGHTTEGAGRSRLIVTHSAKRMEAANCSTGEQKALLLSLLIHHATARRQWLGSPPILLLDEVVSHLDRTHRKDLFDAISEGGMQAWMTGTDAADFQGLEGVAVEVKVADGEVRIEG
jgi:DNA replication and repair protein RecF